jgi:hypothetical protein
MPAGRRQGQSAGIGIIRMTCSSAARGIPVNCVKYVFLIAPAILVLLFGSASQPLAQSSATEELNKRVIELYQAGKFGEAVPLAQQVLAIWEKALGPDHPDVASALNHLAALYKEQRRYARP